MTVTSIQDKDIVCVVDDGGELSNHKGVNVPNVSLAMPYLSEKDMQDSSSTSFSQDAGPTVQIILVFLLYLSIFSPHSLSDNVIIPIIRIKSTSGFQRRNSQKR